MYRKSIQASFAKTLKTNITQIKKLTPTALAIALAGMSLLPVIKEGSPEMVVGMSFLSGMGTEFLKSLGKDMLARLGKKNDEEITRELETEIFKLWNAPGEKGPAFRRELSLFLQRNGILQVALEAVPQETREGMAQSFASLADQFDEFGWVLDGINETLADIQKRQVEQLATQREQLDLQREQLTKTNLLLRLRRERKLKLSTPVFTDENNEQFQQADIPCPYKGLAAFQPQDVDYFFGRETLVSQLLVRLAGASFLGVIGPSGSGKSSLVRAGLVPALWNGDVPGSENWKILITRPGASPLEELAVRVALQSGISAASLLEDLRKNPHSLILAVKQYLISQPDEAKFVLVVDQFEEVFTQCGDENERGRFIAALVDALQNGASRMLIILTLRADFYGRCAAYPHLAEFLSANQILVGAMSEDELRRAITLPAERAGLALEPGLADMVLQDAQGEAGALPMVSQALMETWKRRQGHWLKVDSYRAFGGIRQAIASTAEEVYSAYSEAEREQVRDVFLRLTRLDDAIATDDYRDTRHRVLLRDLVQAGGNTLQMERLLDRLADARLVVKDVGRDSESEVEVTHEALIRHWERLRGWLNEDRDNLRIRQGVSDAAREWAMTGRDGALLNHRGTRLDLALGMSKLPRYHLNSNEQAYLSACVNLIEGEKSAASRRRRFAFGGIALALVVIMTLLAGWGVTSSNSASANATQVAIAQTAQADAEAAQSSAIQAQVETEHEALLGFSNQLVAQSFSKLGEKQDLALLLSAEAFDIENTIQSRSGLLTSLTYSPGLLKWLHGHYDQIYSLAVSPDGGKLASAGTGGQIIIWDLATGLPIGQPLMGHTPAIVQLAFSPDGSRLASSDQSGLILLWDMRSQPFKSTSLFTGYDGGVFELAFSSDGRWLVSGGKDIAVWDGTTLSLVGKISQPGSYVHALDVNPIDSNVIASGGEDNQVRLWNFATGESRILGPHLDWILTMDFSPDGKLLATAGNDASIVLWDVQTGVRAGTLIGHIDAVYSVAFSSDGKLLASTGYDGQVILWDVESRNMIGEPLLGHTGLVNDIALSADGIMLFSGGEDGKIGVWSLNKDTILSHPVAAHSKEVQSIAFASSAKVAISIGADNVIQLWNTADWTSVAQISSPHQGQTLGLAVSPDGTLFATGGDDRLILLWSQSESGWSSQSLSGHIGKITSITFDNEGKLLASTDSRGNLYIWDAREGRLLNRDVSGAPSGASRALFTSDGNFLAVGTPTGVVLLEKDSLLVVAESGNRDPGGVGGSPSTADILSALGDIPSDVGAVVFSPDNKVMAVSFGSEIRFYNVTSRQLDGEPLTGHQDEIVSMAVSPDGTLLASLGSDNLMMFWDMETRQAVGRPITTRGVTLAFDPQQPALILGNDDGTLSVWNMDSAAWRSAICRKANRNLEQAEWKIYLAGRQYKDTCPGVPQVTVMESYQKAQLGWDYYYMDEYELAIESFNDALQLDSSNPDAYSGLGWTYYYKGETDGDYQQAIVNFDKAIEINPYYSAHYDGLGSVYYSIDDYQGMLRAYLKAVEVSPDYGYYYQMVGWAYNGLNSNELAEDYFRRAIELSPEDEYAYEDFGDFLDDLSRYSEAIGMYQKAVELAPEYAWAWRQLGWAYSNAGDNVKAEQALITAVSLAKSDSYYTNLGNFYRDELTDEQKALQNYQKAMEISPDYIDAYRQAGSMYHDMDNDVAAEVYFKQAIEIAPSSASALTYYGDFLDDISRYPEAIKLYLKAVELDPDYYWAWNKLGWAYSNAGDNIKAEQMLVKAATLAEADSYAWYYANLGDFYRNELDNDQNALQSYLKATEIEPDYGYAYRQIGWIYYRLENNQQAEAYFKKAIEAAPEDGYAHADYGNFLDDISRYSEAIDAYLRAVSLDPDYYWAWNKLGWAYSNAGDNLKAEPALLKAAVLAEVDSEGWYYADLGNFYRNELENDQKALQSFLKAAEIEPDYGYAYRQIGWIYYRLENNQQAEAYFKKAIEAAPEDEYAHADYGNFLDDISRYSEAIKLYLKAVELDPDYYWAWNKLGWAYSNAGDNRKAEQALIKAASLAEVDSEGWYYADLGYFYRNELDNDQKALQSYLKATEIEPDYGYAYQQVGWIYYRLENNQQAEAYFKKAIEAAPEDDAVYADYGNFLDNISRYSEAIEMLLKAVEINPGYYWAWNQLGWDYSYVGDNLKAEQALVKAASLAEVDSYSWYYVSVGDFYLTRLEDEQRAIQSYFKALKISPDYAYAYQRIADAYYGLNDRVNALKYYRIYVELEADPSDYVLDRINELSN